MAGKQAVDLYTALTAGAEAAIDSAGPISYPNKELTDDEKGDGLWFSIFIVPANSEPVTLGTGGEDNEPGFMQIDINYPRGKGDGLQLQTADLIASAFPAGKVFTSNGLDVTVTACSITPGRHVGAWYRMSLTINYYARTIRAAV